MKDEAYYLNHPIGRIELRLELLRSWACNRWPEKLCFWVAYHLPRRLVLMALVRVAAGTIGGSEHPDEHNYAKMYDRWEKGIGK